MDVYFKSTPLAGHRMSINMHPRLIVCSYRLLVVVLCKSQEGTLSPERVLYIVNDVYYVVVKGVTLEECSTPVGSSLNGHLGQILFRL